MGENNPIDTSPKALSEYADEGYFGGTPDKYPADEAPQTERAAKLDLLRVNYDKLRKRLDQLSIPPLATVTAVETRDAHRQQFVTITEDPIDARVTGLSLLKRAEAGITEAERILDEMKRMVAEARKIVEEK